MEVGLKVRACDWKVAGVHVGGQAINAIVPVLLLVCITVHLTDCYSFCKFTNKVINLLSPQKLLVSSNKQHTPK